MYRILLILSILLITGCSDAETEEKNLFCSNNPCYSYQSCDEATKSCLLLDGRCAQSHQCADRIDGKTYCDTATNSCIEQTPCTDVTCGGNGVCGIQGERAICACNSGYIADGLNCIPDPKCSMVFCMKNSHCSGGTCVCDEGYLPQGSTCVQNLCAEVTCDGNLVCVDGSCVPPTTPLNIITYNLNDLSYVDAYNSVANVMKGYSIDVAIFQEIQADDRTKLQEAFADQGINFPYVTFTSWGGYGGNEGDDYIACFSKYPLSNKATILDGYYTDPISYDSFDMSNLRPVLKTDLTINNKTITLYGLHLKAETSSCYNCIKQRRAQAHALEEYILDHHNPKQDLIVIAGDANSATDSDFATGSTIDMLSLKSDSDAGNNFIPTNATLLPENTPTHNSYDSRLDHIFLSPSLFQYYREDSVHVPKVSPSPSDHRPVILTVDIPE